MLEIVTVNVFNALSAASRAPCLECALRKCRFHQSKPCVSEHLNDSDWNASTLRQDKVNLCRERDTLTVIAFSLHKSILSR